MPDIVTHDAPAPRPARLRRDGTQRSPRSGSERRRMGDQVNLRIPRPEREAIVAQAAAAGVSVADWMRRRALGNVFCYLPGPAAGRPSERDQVIADLVNAVDRWRDPLAQIGNHTNQLARVANIERKAGRVASLDNAALAAIEAQLAALTAEAAEIKAAAVAALGRR